MGTVDGGLDSLVRVSSGARPREGQGTPGRVFRAESVYNVLKERILNYQLRPAQRIGEIQVGNELGVSRTPAREALRRLEQEGWLILVPRQGYYVRAYTLREFDEIYDLRVAIERHASRTAAEFAPLASLSRVAEDWGALEARQPAMTLLDWLDADETFHTLVAEAGGNRRLVAMLQRINERLRIIRRIDYTRPERATLTRAEHLEILELIQARRAAAAADRMEQHILSSKESVRALAQIYFVQE
ncbi:MAG TPA: GntR family transcriptional regulator [bacterium]|nr:GntR family transcriptional regulator [bacterium]